MALFFKRKKDKPSEATVIKMMTMLDNDCYSWDGVIYHSDIVRACVRPIARAVGRLSPKHIRRTTKENLITNPEPYIKWILDNPNPIMSGQKLREKMTIQLLLNNNAYALIVRDAYNMPIGIYPIICTDAKAVNDQNGRLILQFFMPDGKIFAFDYSDIIHLRNDYNANDIFGSPLAPALAPLMDMVATSDGGIIKAIKNSNIIRWLLQFSSAMRPEDLESNAVNFAETFLSSSSKSIGVAAVDAKATATQIKPTDFVPNAAQTDRTTDRIYSLFNVNENIIQSKLNEDEYNAFYESVIEPIAIDFAEEFSRKLFAGKQLAEGNRIVFDAANLQYASMKTRLALVAMVDRGALTPNEWRETLNLAPIVGGDKPIRRLDTEAVGAADAVNTIPKGGDED